jgi:hypothetical protein
VKNSFANGNRNAADEYSHHSPPPRS